jgi:hypothetical protein
MEVTDAKRLRELEAENAKLKKLLAEWLLDIQALKVVVRKRKNLNELSAWSPATLPKRTYFEPTRLKSKTLILL